MKTGRTVQGQWLTFKVMPHADPLKAVAIISSKKFKKAVDRNHLKRQIFEALEQTIPLNTPFLVAILPKKIETKVPFSEILKDLAILKTALIV